MDFGKKESRLLSLTLFSMGITVLALVAAFILILLIQQPQLFAKKSLPEAMTQVDQEDKITDEIKDGLDVATGFVAQGDYVLVKSTCTTCHSSKLVLQNRASRQGWQEMIIWMQETQKLWDLGENEDKILDYLATYYGPKKKGRRSPLQVEEWYVIE